MLNLSTPSLYSSKTALYFSGDANYTELVLYCSGNWKEVNVRSFLGDSLISVRHRRGTLCSIRLYSSKMDLYFSDHTNYTDLALCYKRNCKEVNVCSFVGDSLSSVHYRGGTMFSAPTPGLCSFKMVLYLSDDTNYTELALYYNANWKEVKVWSFGGDSLSSVQYREQTLCSTHPPPAFIVPKRPSTSVMTQIILNWYSTTMEIGRS